MLLEDGKMVEVSETLNVSASDFFDAIIESVVYDACQATGKNIRKSHLKKGFSYSKKIKNSFGKKENSSVVIQEFKAPSIYKVKFEGSTGYDIMTYKIESVEDEKITVRYSEDFISEFTVEGKSSKMMEKLNNKRAQRRAKKLLKNIEACIQNKQNTEDIQEEVEQ